MDIKGTFNSVLRKLDLEANYEYDEEKRYGPQERFICRITVDGFDFVAQGIGQKKKDAQAIAAREFGNYLIDKGVVRADELVGAENEGESQPIEVKAALYAALGRRKLALPVYDFEEQGSQPNRTFKCVLTIPGFDLVTYGNAIAKKDAQTQSAWDFAKYLVEQGVIPLREFPIFPPEKQPQVPQVAEESEKEDDEDKKMIEKTIEEKRDFWHQ